MFPGPQQALVNDPCQYGIYGSFSPKVKKGNGNYDFSESLLCARTVKKSSSSSLI